MQIRKSELKKKYGIELEKGKYKIYLKNGEYKIYIVKDDTEACLLPGMNKEVGKVLNSKMYEDIIVEKIKQYDLVTITVKNNA